MLDFGNFDNAQLLVLNAYVDNRELLKKICRCINSNYTVEQIEIIGKALSLGLDVTNILNPRLSSESMIVLCDAIMSGLDVKGLDNVYIDSDLLKEIIRIKRVSNFDMSFIKSLSLPQCLDFVNQVKSNLNFDLTSFIEKTKLGREKEICEIKCALGRTK